MKKSILIVISLVAVFFFAGTTEVSAQWTVNVTWSDNNCNCNIITEKFVEWEIRKVSDNSLISDGERDVTNNILNEEELTGNDPIYDDTFYRVCVRVYYKDGSLVDPICCAGTTCENVDGEELTSGDYTIGVLME